MLKPSLDYINGSKSLNLLFWVLVSLFLGALGSGLWELVVSPVFSWLGRLLMQFLSQLSEAYSDSIHSQIGADGPNAILLLPYVVAFVGSFIPFWLLVLVSSYLVSKTKRLLNWRDDREELSDEEISIKVSDLDARIKVLFPRTKQLRMASIACAAVGSVFILHLNIKHTYCYSAAMFIERSIDIMSPHIPPTECLKLRARYRAIETASDFSSLYDDLHQAASSNKVKLPVFTPILRKEKVN